MKKQITVTVSPEYEKNQTFIFNQIIEELYNQGIKAKKEDIKTVFVKKSIDARRRNIKIYLRYDVYIGEEIPDTNKIPEWKHPDGNKTVCIVGFGPAGIFAALKLLEKGIKPVIIERGSETSQRKIDIASISTKHIVNENSNYCFGEGGAGTFSDGKLYTRSNKRGDISSVLNILVHFGADKKILTDAHPHIGTNKLPQIINNIRSFILEMGGEIHFNSKLIDFVFEQNKNTKKVKSIVAENVVTGEKQNISCDYVILATGHSAPDIYRLMAKVNPECLEAKTFAVGVRVEHPRLVIDTIQFHGKTENLGAAEYRLTTQVDGRGVYSFCMCPGGFVVPSSSGKDEIVVNGMSAAERNSKWSNAAIVVETRPEDIPQKFIQKAEKEGCKALAGLYFREDLEHRAFLNGKDQAAPAQRVKDFLNHKDTVEFPPTSYTPGIVASRLDLWLDPFIETRLEQGFRNFNQSMKGFICSDAVMIAVESRTSTPVRISRDKETLKCIGIENLYPAGEGSGYSGGIVSSAMDGENVARMI